jgi:ferrous iron transport protein A
MNAPLPILADALFLSTLKPGDAGTIVSVQGALGVRRRLLEMGLCPGVQVTVLRRAPLGDPIEVRVRGYLLSLRLDQAAQVTLALGQPAVVTAL